MEEDDNAINIHNFLPYIKIVDIYYHIDLSCFVLIIYV